MRDIGSIAAAIVAEATLKRAQLQAAHEAAAEFHEAIADALEHQANIDDCEPGDFDHEHSKERYPIALGKAAVALQKMPVKWAAILSVELDAIKPASNVVPLRPAAE